MILALIRRFWSRPFIRSSLLHTLVIIACIFWASPFSFLKQTTESPIQLAIESIAPRPNETTTLASRSRALKSRHANSHPAGRRAVSLADLGLKYGSSLNDEARDRNEKYEASEDRIVGKGAVDFVRESREASLYQLIYGLIDASLLYPAEFVERGIEGAVSATLVFDKQGTYLRERGKIDAPNPYLRALAAKTLRRAFSEPINLQNKHVENEFVVFVNFSFAITENHDDALIKARNAILKNRLVFYRSAHKSAMQWKLGPLSGLGFIPAVSVDVLAVGTAVAQLFNHKTRPVDPMRQYEEDPSF